MGPFGEDYHTVKFEIVDIGRDYAAAAGKWTVFCPKDVLSGPLRSGHKGVLLRLVWATEVCILYTRKM